MTLQEYRNWLEKVEVLNPNEPLLKKMQEGFTHVNCIYMKSAIVRLEKLKPKLSTLPDNADRFDDNAGNADDTLREFWRIRTHLFGEMNKLSNHFHNCTNDAQRKANSKEICKIWDKISEVKWKITHYEKTGESLQEENESDFEMPDDPAERVRKLASVRVQISKIKKNIEHLASNGADVSKIEKQEKNRQKYEYFKQKLENILAG